MEKLFVLPTIERWNCTSSFSLPSKKNDITKMELNLLKMLRSIILFSTRSKKNGVTKLIDKKFVKCVSIKELK